MLPILSPSFTELESRPIAHTRMHYGIENDSFVFMFSWDFYSSYQRKNPMAVLKSFVTAFGANSTVYQEKRKSNTLLPKPLLVLKSINAHTMDGERMLTEMKALVASEPQLPHVVFLEKHMTAAETVDLFKQANVYVSLHRSEGNGSTDIVFISTHNAIDMCTQTFTHLHICKHICKHRHKHSYTSTCMHTNTLCVCTHKICCHLSGWKEKHNYQCWVLSQALG